MKSNQFDSISKHIVIDVNIALCRCNALMPASSANTRTEIPFVANSVINDLLPLFDVAPLKPLRS